MKKVILLLALLYCSIAVFSQVLTAKKADSIAANAFNGVIYPNDKLKPSIDSLTAVYRAVLSSFNYSVPVVYTISGPVTLQSNHTYQYLTIDMKGKNAPAFIGNNVTNVHITHCRVLNTPNMAIKLYKCTNVVADYNYFNMVMFGGYAQNSQTIKFNNNQLLNLNDQGVSGGYKAHAFQFDNVTGGGNQMNYNRIENIAGVAVKPHDILNIYHSDGLPGDSIQCIGNWVRGGQIVYGSGQTASSNGAAGVAFGDQIGKFIVVRGNILVNPGGIGIQTVGGATGLKADHNTIYIKFPTKTGMIILGCSVQNTNLIGWSYNHVNVTNDTGFNGVSADGQPAYWNPKTTPTPTDWNKNVWQDSKVTANILPAQIITFK